MTAALRLQTPQSHRPAQPAPNRGRGRGNCWRDRECTSLRDEIQKELTEKLRKELDVLKKLTSTGTRTKCTNTAATADA